MLRMANNDNTNNQRALKCQMEMYKKARLTKSAVWEFIVKIGYYTHTHTLAQTLLDF